ncbi:hypothetical protein KL919_004784 [Ogataea angusta]|nr:hypothetical protein KL919_004784 [Ogataea angusta]
MSGSASIRARCFYRLRHTAHQSLHASTLSSSDSQLLIVQGYYQQGGYPPQQGGYPPQQGGYQQPPQGYYQPQQQPMYVQQQPPKQRDNGCGCYGGCLAALLACFCLEECCGGP